MNNNDMSYLMNMINKMDKNELANNLSKMNQMLSPQDRQKLIKALGSFGSNNSNK